MSRSKVPIDMSNGHFGTKLADCRKAAGYSQRDLSRETGISQRMIAYYEKNPQYPPMHVTAVLCAALGIPAAQLLALKNTQGEKLKDMRIRRRLKQIEELEEKEKRQVIQLLDTFIENNRLKQKPMSL